VGYHPAVRKLSALGVLVGLTLFSVSDADAQGVFAPPQKGGGVITINEVTIVGRVQKPVASVDVSKIQPKLTLAELRQPFLDRIEEAARKDPF
jgi:hypothetical protein